MAEDTAGKWIIGILIYFVGLFAVLTFVNTMVSEYAITDSSVTYSGGSAGLSISNLGGCVEPRSIGKYSKSCKKLVDIGSVYNNETCESVEGCSWVAENTLFGWGESTETCKGTINATYYNDGVAVGTTVFGGATESICSLTNVSNDAYLCSFVGCTWASSNTDELIEISSVKGVWEIVKDIITLNVNFGSSSGTFNTMLNFIFIVIPLILLVIAGIIMLPFT